MVGYSVELKSAEKTAKAIGKELRISPKSSVEICTAIRGMNLKKAEAYLEEVAAEKRAVPYYRYRWEIGHRRGPGFGGGLATFTGRYPQKAAKYILKILKDVESNAEYKGLDVDGLRIIHVAAQRGRVIRGQMQRAHGRATAWNEHTTNIEIIVEETEE